MRTGAIFARGSCRALKWMALVGMVFALGAGSADAQITVDSPNSGAIAEPMTGTTSVQITVTANVTIEAGTPDGTITLTASLASALALADVTPATPHDDDDDIAVVQGDLSFPYEDIPATGDPVEMTLSDTFTVVVGDDTDAEDERFNIDFAAPVAPSGVTSQVDGNDDDTLDDLAAPEAEELTIDDAQTQMFVWGPADLPEVKEGQTSPSDFTLTATPTPNQLSYDTQIHREEGPRLGYTYAGLDTTVTLDSGTDDMTVMITPPTNDENRSDDEITLVAAVTGGDDPSPLTITVEDINALPMIAMDVWEGTTLVPPDMLEEGKTYALRAYLADDMGMPDTSLTAAEELTISLMMGNTANLDTDDYTLDDDEIKILSGASNGTVNLTVKEDDDITAGGEMFEVTGTVAGDANYGRNPSPLPEITPLTLTITQADDETLITVLTDREVQEHIDSLILDADENGDEKLNPGEGFTLDPDDLFEPKTDYSLSYMGTTEDDEVTVTNSSNMVTVTGAEVGMAEVTVTATATAAGATVQTQANMIAVTFNVPVAAVVPDAPTGVTATDATTVAGSGMVTLTWTAPADDGGSPITGYDYRDEVDGRMGDWTDTGSTAISLTMRADIGTAIAYEVRAKNAVGPGASMKSNSVIPKNPVVDPVPPGAPTDVTAAAADGAVTLTWTAPADNGGAAILRYEYISRVDGRADEEWMSTGSTATTVTVDADNGTAIAYDVRAVNSAGGGEAARSNTVTPMAALTAPGVPRNLTAAAGDTEVVLDWDEPNSGGAPSGYDYRVTGSGVSGEWTNTTATRATVTGLTNDTEYTFYVRAVNSAGMSGEVSEEATPMAPDPGVQVTVKEVKTSTTNVPESGGLEVTVVANVPAGTKGSDDKVAPIAMRRVMVEFPTDDTSIKAGENADDGELTPLGDLLWEKITRTEKDSTQEFKFRVAVGQDLDAEDEKFQVEVSIDGASMKSKVITIDDAQEQTYELSLPSDAKGAVKEDGSETLTLAAKPERTIDIGFTLALNPNDPTKYTLGATSGTFGTDSASTTISAKADGNRDDDTVTVTAYMSGTLGNNVEIDSLDITVTDINALPTVKAEVVDSDGKAVSPQPESVAEGGSLKVKLTVVDKDGKAAKAAEKLSISLMPTGTADGQDYRLSTHPIEIAKDKESSAVVDLMVTEDSDVGDETLMFTAVVSGDSKIGTEKKEVPGVLSLMFTDGTEKLVWANSQAEVEAAIYAAKNAGAGDDMTLTEGEMIEVMGNALFSKAEGVTLSYTAESSMGSVASAAVNGAAVTITAMSEGTTEITITAHASRPSGVMILDQTDPGMASIMFPVEVGLEALAITLTGPEDMNLAEGMSAMVTATANRPVSADTTVMLMRDRSKSTAGDADYSADAITISAGMSSGSTMVMAIEDGVTEDMEELVLYGMTEGMAGEVTGEVMLTLWDAAVPALPIIAQLLLGGLLAVGGIRRYRRRS